MKRLLTLCLVFCLLCVPALAETAEPETLADRVFRLTEDAESLIRMGEDDLLDLTGIDPAECADWIYLADHNAISGRELIVVVALDEDCAAAAEQMLQHYLETRLRETRNYFPDAYQALSHAKVVRQGLTVILSVASPLENEAQLLLSSD